MPRLKLSKLRNLHSTFIFSEWELGSSKASFVISQVSGFPLSSLESSFSDIVWPAVTVSSACTGTVSNLYTVNFGDVTGSPSKSHLIEGAGLPIWPSAEKFQLEPSLPDPPICQMNLSGFTENKYTNMIIWDDRKICSVKSNTYLHSIVMYFSFMAHFVWYSKLVFSLNNLCLMSCFFWVDV